MKTISSGGPCRYTLVDGQAAMALAASDIKDLDGGEEERRRGGRGEEVEGGSCLPRTR